MEGSDEGKYLVVIADGGGGDGGRGKGEDEGKK